MQTVVKIVLLEDDPMQAESLSEEILKLALPKAELKYFGSEYSFLKAIDNGELMEWNPQFAILDLLISYYSLEDLAEMGEAPEVKRLDPKQAGIRCRAALQKVCPAVKIGIITVLDDTPDGFVIRKGDEDENNEKLIEFLTQGPAALGKP